MYFLAKSRIYKLLFVWLLTAAIPETWVCIPSLADFSFRFQQGQQVQKIETHIYFNYVITSIYGLGEIHVMGNRD